VVPDEAAPDESARQVAGAPELAPAGCAALRGATSRSELERFFFLDDADQERYDLLIHMMITGLHAPH
jgi:hypothetical protein